MDREDFRSKEEAAEAWNTWPSRFKKPDRVRFLERNANNTCGQFVDSKGYMTKPQNSNIFGQSEMFPDGTFSIGWPLLPKSYERLFSIDELENVLSLRIRWCALFENVYSYRREITKLLRSNTKCNEEVNKQLAIWNQYLSTHGFQTFRSNDLRGICLAGLDFGGVPYGSCELTHFDFSFADMSLVSLRGAKLYGCKMDNIFAQYSDFSYSVMQHINATNSWFHVSDFNGAALDFAHLSNCNFNNCCCDGTSLYGARIPGSTFMNTSFDTDFSSTVGKKKCNLDGITGNDDTQAQFDFVRE